MSRSVPPARPLALALRLLVAVVLLSALPDAASAQGRVPGGGSLLSWLGLEDGDRLAYVGPDGERVCVEVAGPVTLAGRRYATLLGMPWPGLASDGQVFLPLDGVLGVGVIRGLSLNPADAIHWLLEPSRPRFLARVGLAHPGAVPGDGWYAIGDSAERPLALLHVWCHACSDAGTYVWMERGRGITRIEERTIAGPRRTTLIGEGCDAQTPEVEVRVDPSPERRP